MNEDDKDLPPEEEPKVPDSQHILEAFDKLMKGIEDPVENGYSVLAEMFNGLVTTGMRRADAALMVASYVAVHDYMNPSTGDSS